MVKFYRLGSSDGQRELPREWAEKRYTVAWETYSEQRWRDHAIEVAPGVRVLLLATGNTILPDGQIHMAGATIAVWDETQ